MPKKYSHSRVNITVAYKTFFLQKVLLWHYEVRHIFTWYQYQMTMHVKTLPPGWLSEALQANCITTDKSTASQLTSQECHNWQANHVTIDKPIVSQLTSQLCHNWLANCVTIDKPIVSQLTSQPCHNWLANRVTIDKPTVSQLTSQSCHN